ncbi:MAG: hypothetical protein J6K94_01770 [Ruminiclostridium sp.]|nr:hypothetical protein [Ruminiclostridium sp.]
MKLSKMTKTILMVAAVCLELAAFACVILSHLEEVTQLLNGVQKKLSGCCRCRADDSLETYDDEFEDWDV